MSPSETSSEANLLEHPAEAFRYYRQNCFGEEILEEKHMGSRAVVVLARDAEAAQRRFGVSDVDGVCYTRTGRRFFDHPDLQAAFLGRLRKAADSAGLWDELATDWMVLDAELMPWSLKAQELLRVQYAPVGTSAKAGLRAATAALGTAPEAPEIAELQSRTAARLEAAERYVDAYRRYCWTVASVEDLKLAPFHLLASEGKVHTDMAHGWHMTQLERLSREDPMVVATPHRIVDLTDQAAMDEATAWWEELTSSGGEGMVVKPLSFVARGPRGMVQPAIKVRGPEYLRIIYGPEYLLDGNLERLRSRALGAKRSLAVREFALGVEGLERFVRNEPLRRVHECVFAVLALESEPVDPRL
jgi:protein phosphatase